MEEEVMLNAMEVVNAKRIREENRKLGVRFVPQSKSERELRRKTFVIATFFVFCLFRKR